jgi:hypothetical protein
MRKAAGIILIIYGVTTMGSFLPEWIRFNLIQSNPSSGIQPEPSLGFAIPSLVLGLDRGPVYEPLIITVLLSIFFIIGGVFCLKRKYWALCFISSLFLHFWMIVSFLGDFITYFWYGFLVPGAILPLIFICLRKSEWQEISA